MNACYNSGNPIQKLACFCYLVVYVMKYIAKYLAVCHVFECWMMITYADECWRWWHATDKLPVRLKLLLECCFGVLLFRCAWAYCFFALFAWHKACTLFNDVLLELMTAVVCWCLSHEDFPPCCCCPAVICFVGRMMMMLNMYMLLCVYVGIYL
jgi:hypothetical protein